MEIDKDQNFNSSDLTRSINEILISQTNNYNLTKLDIADNYFQATYILNLKNIDMLTGINKLLQTKHPGIKISFIDQNQLPNI